MIQLTIRELMMQKGIKPSAYRLTRSGIGLSAAKTYLDGRAKSIKLEDIEKLCLFFRCTPRELMCIEDTDAALPEGHPLEKWKNETIPFPIQELHSLYPDELAEAQEALLEIINRRKKMI